MEALALLIAASLHAGSILALAGLGLLINERAGVLNLGAEGMMLCGALAGFAATSATGGTLAGFAAAGLAGALMAAVFGWLVIWLNTNQYATGLALSLFGAGLTAFAGQPYTQVKLPDTTPFAVPYLSELPFLGAALFKQHPLVYAAVALTLVLTWAL